MTLNNFLDEISKIRTQKSRDCNNKLHKLILLLSVIDLFESGDIVDNKIIFSQTFIDRFVKCFSLISKGDDWFQSSSPYFHLSSSSFGFINRKLVKKRYIVRQIHQ